MNKYTVLIYRKTTIELYANSESEAEEMAIDKIIRSKTINNINTEICEIETTLSTDSS